MEMEKNAENRPLLRKAFLAVLVTVICTFLVLFVSAGTPRFWQAWAYMGVYTLYLVPGTFYLWKTAPDLLRRRLKWGPGAEKDPEQKVIQAVSFVLVVLLYLVPGLDRRFQWTDVPVWMVSAGLAFFAVGLASVFYVSRYNHYMAATITVEEGQPVVTTGPYALVRHPMYAGTLLWLFSTPVALGSFAGLIPAVMLCGTLVVRLLAEERFLRKNLAGYADYCEKVHWRLIPHVF